MLIPDYLAFHYLFLFLSDLDHGNSTMAAKYDGFNIMKHKEGDDSVIEVLHPLAFAA